MTDGTAASAKPTVESQDFVPPLWLVLVLTGLVVSIGAGWKYGCGNQFRDLCYTDITSLYGGRGLFDGARMYLDQGGGRYLEYPVLIGTVMQVAGLITGTGGNYGARALTFLLVNSVILLAFALAMSTAIWFTRPERRAVLSGRLRVERTGLLGPTAALMVAVSPVLLLDSTINWDLVAVAFTAAALWAWSRDATFLTGMFLGLGTSAKLYPGLLLWPLAVMLLRDQRMRDLGRVVVGAAGAWLITNLPVMVLSPAGWKEFYAFSQNRGIDFGSGWFAWSLFGHDVPPTTTVNLVSSVVVALAMLGVGALAWWCRGATLAQLGFLAVAVFVVVNKVYSPQYVLWLLPLAALARPRWPAFLLWQLGEVIYFVAIWRYLLGYGMTVPPDGAIDTRTYAWAVVLRLLLTAGFAVLVLVDVVKARPQVQTTRSALVVV